MGLLGRPAVVMPLVGGQAKYFLHLLSFAAAVLFQLVQKHSHGLHLVQQEVRAGDGFGHGLIEHLAVVPDPECLLQIPQPFELRFISLRPRS
jgi:hypothetical protein